MTSELTREQATDKELQMLIDSHEKGTAMFLRVDAYYLMAKELQERRKAEQDSEPVAWTDEEELRDVERSGCGYLFTLNPVTPHADERRIILLYRHAQQPVVPEEKPMPNPLSMYAVDAVAAISEVRGWNACRAAMLAAAPKEVR